MWLKCSSVIFGVVFVLFYSTPLAMAEDKPLLPVTLDQLSRILQLANAKNQNFSYSHQCESYDDETSCADKIGDFVVTYSATTIISGITRVNFGAHPAQFSDASEFAAGIVVAAEDDQDDAAVQKLSPKIAKIFDTAFIGGFDTFSLKSTIVTGIRMDENQMVLLRISRQ